MLREYKTDTQHFFVDENGLFQGEYKTYHPNGKMYQHFFFLNDKRHGQCKDYYDNGQLWAHVSYQNGNHHGEYTIYHRDGGKKRETIFFQGIDLHVDPNTLTEKDKAYIMLSGRLPHRD